MYRSQKGQGLVLIGVHSDDWKKGLDTAKQHKIDYPITNDVKGTSGKNYRIDGYPTVFVIDKKGIIRDVDPRDLDASVKKLLAQKA